mgnify:CR=1 FL=1
MLFLITASVMDLYIIPVSINLKPSLLARRVPTADFPAATGPSIAIVDIVGNKLLQSGGYKFTLVTIISSFHIVHKLIGVIEVITKQMWVYKKDYHGYSHTERLNFLFELNAAFYFEFFLKFPTFHSYIVFAFDTANTYIRT